MAGGRVGERKGVGGGGGGQHGEWGMGLRDSHRAFVISTGVAVTTFRVGQRVDLHLLGCIVQCFRCGVPATLP